MRREIGGGRKKEKKRKMHEINATYLISDSAILHLHHDQAILYAALCFGNL